MDWTRCYALKGTQIGSGSIIGAKSLVSNKKIPSNSIWGGNPARNIRNNIFFDGRTSHYYRKKDTENSMTYNDTTWIYEYDESTLGFEYLDEINNKENNEEKIEFLLELRNNTSHNRFFTPTTIKSKKNEK